MGGEGEGDINHMFINLINQDEEDEDVRSSTSGKGGMGNPTADSLENERNGMDSLLDVD